MQRDHHGVPPSAMEWNCMTSVCDCMYLCVVNSGAPSSHTRLPCHYSATSSEKQTSVRRSLEMSGLREVIY